MLWNEPRLANVTCAWSWGLYGINPASLTCTMNSIANTTKLKIFWLTHMYMTYINFKQPYPFLSASVFLVWFYFPMPAAAHLLRLWVRIPPGAWIFVRCECRVWSGTGLCDELITRPEESYRLCCVVVCDLETSRIAAPFIYDISSLTVNDLTLILRTWRKWWTPNNASK
jgi:hypothetical protein